MDTFRAALINWMDQDAHLSVRGLATTTGIDPSALSQIRTGQRTITAGTLARLLTAIRNTYGLDPAKRLLIAYLQDEVPESMAGTIAIRDASQNQPHTPSDPLSRALAWVESRTATDPDFAAWLIQLHNMVEDTGTPQAAPEPTQAPAAAPGSVTFTIRAEEPLRAAEPPTKYQA